MALVVEQVVFVMGQASLFPLVLRMPSRLVEEEMALVLKVQARAPLAQIPPLAQ